MDVNAVYRKHPMVAPIHDRIDTIEARLGRIESAVSAILEKLQMSSIDTFKADKSPTALPSNEPDTSKVAVTVPVDPKTGPYSYRSLNTAIDEIRLLAMEHSGNDTDPIKAELIYVSLDAKRGSIRAKDGSLPMYTALSYTWGDPKLEQSITLNGHPFPVTRNVETALRHMRKTKPASTSYWWVDQICINQKDILERGQQVGLMRRIYKSAYGVSVWLGEPADDSDLAIKLLSELGIVKTRGPGQKEEKHVSVLPEQAEKNWKAISALFRRAWWERAWIRQEVALNSNVNLYCGTTTCRFSLAAKAAEVLEYLESSHSYSGPASAVATSTSMNLGSLRLPFYHQARLVDGIFQQTHRGSLYMDLEACFFVSRASEATDPRDKVFSVLGLADPDIYKLTADYQLLLKEVLVAAAKAILPTPSGLDLLAVCQNPERQHGLPSWVPNLSDPWKAHPIDVLKYKRKRYLQPIVKFDGDVLSISGIHVDTVKELCDATVQQDDTPEQLTALHQKWKDFVAQVQTWVNVGGDQQEYAKLLASTSGDSNWVHLLSLGNEMATRIMYLQQNAQGSEAAMKQMEGLNYNVTAIRASLLPEDALKSGSEQIIQGILRKFSVGRRLCLTSTGNIGVVPADARVGDSVTMFFAGQFPSILRKTGDGEKHVLVGEAFFLKAEPLQSYGSSITIV